MPTLQASDPATLAGSWNWPPSMSDLTASTATLTGWYFAKGCIHPGIVSIATNADETKTSGASTGNEAAWAVSAFGADRPMMAKIHVSEKPKRRITATP